MLPSRWGVNSSILRVYLLLNLIIGKRATWKICGCIFSGKNHSKAMYCYYSVGLGLPLFEGIIVLAGSCFILLESYYPAAPPTPRWAWLAASEIQMGKLSFKELITCVELPARVEWRQTWAAAYTAT